MSIAKKGERSTWNADHLETMAREFQMPYFDFDLEKCRSYILRRNPNAKIFPISARTGEGVDALAAWLLEETEKWRNGENE